MKSGSEEYEKMTALYKKYKQLMFFVANRILHDDEASEDAVQEAFIRIMKKINKINEIECNKTKSFVVIVVERVAIDIYRSRVRKNEILFDGIENPDYFLEYSQDISHIEVKEIMNIIQKMPEKYTTILTLRYYYEYTTREIAELLSMKESTVRSIVLRGKKHLIKKGVKPLGETNNDDNDNNNENLKGGR